MLLLTGAVRLHTTWGAVAAGAEDAGGVPPGGGTAMDGTRVSETRSQRSLLEESSIEATSGGKGGEVGEERTTSGCTALACLFGHSESHLGHPRAPQYRPHHRQ